MQTMWSDACCLLAAGGRLWQGRHKSGSFSSENGWHSTAGCPCWISLPLEQQVRPLILKRNRGELQKCEVSCLAVHSEPGKPGQRSKLDLQSLCAAGRLDEILDVLQRMDRRGTTASYKLYAQIMRLCGEMKALLEAKRVHAHLTSRRLEWDAYLGSGIVEMYVKCESLLDAEQVHNCLPHRNEFSWSALITGYTNCGQGKEALRIYKEMREEGVEPNAQTFVAALKACGSLRDLETGRRIHVDVIKSGNESVMFVATTVMDMYAKCGSMVDARRVFDSMPKHCVVSWNAIIMGYAQQEDGEGALQLYADMQREGIVSEARTFVGVLKACASLAGREQGKTVDGKLVKIESLEKGRAIHSQVTKSGVESNLFLANTLVDMYSKCGSMVDARRVFHNMPKRNIVSWNALIAGYADQGESEEAIKLFAQMQEEGASANSLTFVSVLKACGNIAALETGKKIHAQIRQIGLDSDAMVAAALIDMHAKCGCMVDAKQLFDALPIRDLVTWNTLIAGYARQGESELVISLFEKMRQEGREPDVVTFLSVLTLCSHAGLVDEGLKYFEAMSKGYSIAPTLEHYTCMVDLLGRAGRVEEAVAMVKSMPVKPDLAMWLNILGACRKFKNVELGRYAFDCGVKFDKKDATAYVTMSNIYADACMWQDRDTIQALRISAGAWKKPGQTWIEIGGKVHRFLVGDQSHSESNEIYDKIKETAVKKATCCLPTNDDQYADCV